MARMHDTEIRDTARDQWQRDGEIEIDEDAAVSRGGESGCYVQAWVWVDLSADYGQHEAPDTRVAGDDDGVEYADPRDEQAARRGGDL